MIYGDKAKDIADSVIGSMRYLDTVSEPEPYQNYWDESDVWMIAYATSIHADARS